MRDVTFQYMEGCNTDIVSVTDTRTAANNGVQRFRQEDGSSCRSVFCKCRVYVCMGCGVCHVL